MKALSVNIGRSEITFDIILDSIAIALVYLIPTLSHLSGLPFFYAEPMRLMLILSIVHSRKINSFFLALSLPLFSYLISAHPVFPKMLLISFELSLNILLIGLIKRRINNIFSIVAISIILSKLAYYIAKYFMLDNAILNMDFISTPIEAQLISTLVFSLYAYFGVAYQKRNNNKNSNNDN